MLPHLSRFYADALLNRYGDMYPVTPVGRVLACAGALSGVATIGILVSVLVDRYQRIYNRKKFFPEHITSIIDASDSEHEQKEDFIRKKLTGLARGTSNLAMCSPAPTLRRASTRHPSTLGLDATLASLSHVRCIVSFTDVTNNKATVRQIADELIKQLIDATTISEQPMHWKLISENID
jgi:hypothetical protein